MTGHPGQVESASQRCSVCILPAEYPGIEFDEHGECNYCRRWKLKWSAVDFEKQSVQLESILGTYRGSAHPYDCLIGLSGGKDSVYAAYLLKQYGMRPLACTFDNGFMTEAALHNITSAVDALSIGHVFVHPDASEVRRLYKHFALTSGEFCSVCNVGIRSSLYRTADAYGIKLIVSGQSNRTEANSPKEFFTCSNGYFANVARSAASEDEIAGYMYVSQLERVRRHLTRSAVFLQLPSYLPWKEEEFKQVLATEVGWRGAVGEQHADCTMSDAKEYLKLRKFGVTEYTAKLSSLVRDGQISREDALERMRQHAEKLLENEAAIRGQIMSALGLSEAELEAAITVSHLPYISKTDSRISSLKNTYERTRFKRAKSAGS